MKVDDGRTDSEESDLGLDVPITRRDFVGASLVGAGAALLAKPAMLLADAKASNVNPEWDGFGGIGDYKSSHGNMWSTLTAGHKLRDGKFGGDRSGRAAVDTNEHFDLVVVGGGISGLAAAAYFQKLRGGRCLVLDNHTMVGGEAKRNEFDVNGVRLIGPQGSNNFSPILPTGWAGEFWKEIELPYGDGAFEYQPWASGVEPLEIARENYNFQIWGDEFESHGFFFKQPDGSLRLVRDAFGSGFGETPWDNCLRRDFLRWRSNPKIYQGRDLARWLDTMTYEQLLVRELGLDSAVARYADPILAAGAGGLGCDVISAQLAAQLGFPCTANGAANGSRSRKLADVLPRTGSFPGGNDGIMRHILKRLIPTAIYGEGFAGVLNGAIRFDQLDNKENRTRIRLGATVVRVANLVNDRVEAIYSKDGRLFRITAEAVVMANGAWNSQYILADASQERRESFQDFVRAPILVVNVALRQWRFMYEMGITAASYRDTFGFSCNIRQPMVVGGYRAPLHPDRPVVLTFYVTFENPGSPLKVQAAAARTELLGTTYRDYERKVRKQLVALFGRAGFDPRTDVAGIILNRWGHAYVCPAPGFYFGRGDNPAPVQVMREAVGQVAFANAELNGHQNWTAAAVEGKRAVEQLFSHKA